MFKYGRIITVRGRSLSKVKTVLLAHHYIADINEDLLSAQGNSFEAHQRSLLMCKFFFFSQSYKFTLDYVVSLVGTVVYPGTPNSLYG